MLQLQGVPHLLSSSDPHPTPAPLSLSAGSASWLTWGPPRLSLGLQDGGDSGSWATEGPLRWQPQPSGAGPSLQGHDSTLGLSLNESVPAECDSVVVQVLKLQGAVPFVHTNVPQSMFRWARVWAGPGALAPVHPGLTRSCFPQL